MTTPTSLWALKKVFGANILPVKKIVCCSTAMKFKLTIANMET